MKPLAWSLSISSDNAFPLFQQAYSGNTGDVETYVEQWHHLIDLFGKRDFLFIALQIVVLIERAARRNIQARDKSLDDFMPNKKDYRTPKRNTFFKSSNTLSAEV